MDFHDATKEVAQYPLSDLVVVIDRSAMIESLMTRIIVSYCSPRQEARPFMWNIVLDSSVMSLGAKAKVVMAIAGEVDFELKRNALYKVLELRNAFAHHATDANLTIGSGSDGEAEFFHEFWLLRSSGKLDKKKRKDAFEEFGREYAIARDSLIELANLTAKFMP
jgi:hypothetical protein